MFAELKRGSFSELSITSRMSFASLFGSAAAHRRSWVSSNSFIRSPGFLFEGMTGHSIKICGHDHLPGEKSQPLRCVLVRGGPWHNFREWSAGLGDNETLSVCHGVEQSRQVRFSLVDIDDLHAWNIDSYRWN